MSATLGFNASEAPLRRPGVVIGIAVSLLLHALLIFGYRIGKAPPAPEPAPAKTITVWLQPVRPPVAAVNVKARAEPERKKVEQPSQPQRTPLARPQPQPQPMVTLAPPAEQEMVEKATPAIPPPAADPLHPEQTEKRFDMNAALKTARKVARDKDPARANLPVAQLDDHPLYPEQTESELARKMDRARRPDCRQSGGGLLAPLGWLLDKKDGGCKW